MKRYIVDRIENGFAVCEAENGEMTEIELCNLPDVKSGDCIVETEGNFSVDKQYTEQRRKEIIALQESLWE